MKHGGKRPGAGRPKGTVIDPMMRMRIGAEAEQLWCRAWERNKRAALSRLPRREHIAAIHAKRQAIPVHERKQYRQSDAAELDQDDLDGELREAAQMDDMDDTRPPRRRQVIVKRPMGQHERIKKAIARRWSCKLGRRVTPRTVEACWKEIRRIKADSHQES